MQHKWLLQHYLNNTGYLQSYDYFVCGVCVCVYARVVWCVCMYARVVCVCVCARARVWCVCV